MPDFIPVSGDPFNDPPTDYIPVDHDPFDPLAASAGIAPAGTPTIADMNLGPSWVQKALEQSQRDREAFAKGGVREMLKDTEGTQDLAGGFGGGGIAGTTRTAGVAGRIVPELETVFHGSSGPFSFRHGETKYLAKEHETAQGYATERSISRKGEPTVTKLNVDTSEYAGPDDFAEAVDKHYPDDTWLGKYPSIAAVAEDPKVKDDLIKKGFKGVKNVWDFDMRDSQIERQVHVAYDPTTVTQSQPEGIRAFHASPHDFDKFDISKIGTGEGAQVYGHGLYFAENPAVAQDYRAAFAAQSHKSSDLTDVAEALPVSLRYHSGVADKILNHVHSAMILDGVPPSEFLDKHTVGKGLEPAYKVAADIVAKGSKMYEVNIKADPEHFLDWDKPLSEQHPMVHEAVRKIYEDEARADYQKRGFSPELTEEYLGNARRHMDTGAMTGEGFVRTMKGNELSEQATNKLREAGIPGIKYLDQGSRGIKDPVEQAAKDVIDFYGGDRAEAVKQFENRLAGVGSKHQSKDIPFRGDRPNDPQQVLNLLKSDWKVPKETRNYVVFDDKLIDIIKKYGLAGLVAGGAAHFSTQPVDHDPFEASQ